MENQEKNYLDYYRERVLATGSNEQERISNNLNRDFHQLVKRSPNSVDIFYEGEQYEAVLNSGNSRVGAQTERKVIQYLLTDLSLKLPEGAIFTMHQHQQDEQTTWIVLHREIHSYYGYYKFKIVELDYNLQYVDKFGIVKEVPAYINGTGEFDIKAYFRYSLNTVEEIPNRALNVIWAANDDIVTDLRIMIGDEVWKVVDSDKISIKGVYYTTLYKTTRDEINDSVSQQLANVTNTGIQQIYSNFGENDLTIGLNTIGLKFYSKKDGKIVESLFSYESEDPGILEITKLGIIPQKIGETRLLVKDEISGINKIFNIAIQTTAPDYCFVIGNDEMAIESTIKLEISTNRNIRVITIDTDLIKVNQEGNNVFITSKDKIGNTTVEFIDDEGNITKKPISIKSPWVS